MRISENILLSRQLERLWHEAVSQDFNSFLHQVVASLNPGAVFFPSWHLEVMSEYLQAVEAGDIHRLIINIPPRYLKSLCVSVAWPAWILGRNPSRRIIAASYSNALSLKHSLDCRQVMTSPWYKKIYPTTHIMHGQNEKHKYMTTEYGFRLAVSVGGTLTGEGGDILIVDDPLNPSQAESSLFRNMANRWFEHTFSSRLNNKKEGGIVVVMQRLHPQDLSGFLQEKGSWEVLKLQAMAETTQHFIGAHFDYRYHTGECLHPQREDHRMLEQMRYEMGSYAFTAQYQQQPAGASSGMIKSEWWHRFTALPDAETIIQSWDTAIKAGMHNDYSVCVTLAVTGTDIYVLDVLREKLEYPALRRVILEQAERWNPSAILIEDKASGQSLLQDLRYSSRLPLIPRMPKKDKLTRFASITPYIEAGRVWLPMQAAWLAEFELELSSFPDVMHDDQADSLSQALLWLREREKIGSMKIRRI